MPTFIDESGDTGHSGSSLPYFRLAAIWMPSENEADGFRNDVRQLRQALKLEDDFEFKFNRTHIHPNRRRAFLEVALFRDFRFGFCGIDKTKIYWGKATKDEQHWATAKSIAMDLMPVYHGAEQKQKPLYDPIFVDDNGDAGFLETINSIFRGLPSQLHQGVPMVRKPRFRNSEKDAVLQLADMICGSCGAFLDGDKTWYRLLKEKCTGWKLGLESLPDYQ